MQYLAADLLELGHSLGEGDDLGGAHKGPVKGVEEEDSVPGQEFVRIPLMLTLAFWDGSTHLPLKSARLMFLMSPLTTAGPEKAGAGFWICKYEILDQYDWSVQHTIQIVRGREEENSTPSPPRSFASLILTSKLSRPQEGARRL